MHDLQSEFAAEVEDTDYGLNLLLKLKSTLGDSMGTTRRGGVIRHKSRPHLVRSTVMKSSLGAGNISEGPGKIN